MNGQHSSAPGHHGPEKGRRLPNAGSFKKGQSGNRRGRPPGSGKHTRNVTATEILLDKTVTIGGKTREISAEEAIQQRTFKDALAGNRMATREVIKWIIRVTSGSRSTRPHHPSRRSRGYSRRIRTMSMRRLCSSTSQHQTRAGQTSVLTGLSFFLSPGRLNMGLTEGGWVRVFRSATVTGCDTVPAILTR